MKLRVTFSQSEFSRISAAIALSKSRSKKITTIYFVHSRSTNISKHQLEGLNINNKWFYIKLLFKIIEKGYTRKAESICTISSNMAKDCYKAKGDTNPKKCVYKPAICIYAGKYKLSTQKRTIYIMFKRKTCRKRSESSEKWAFA